MNSFLSRPLVKYTLISFIVIALFLTLLPFAIQFGAEYAMKEQGAKKVNIEDINLNLFTGKFELKKLNAQFDEQAPLELERLAIELEVSALFQSKIILNNIDLKGFKAHVNRDEKGAISINGYQIPLSKETESTPQKTTSDSLKFAVNSITLSDSSLIYQEHGFEQNLALNTIQIRNIKSWDKEAITHVVVKLKEGKTHINADVKLALFRDIKNVNGTLSIHGLKTQTYKKFHQPHIDKLQAKINADIDFNIDLAETIKGDVKHNITLSNISAHYNKLAYSLGSLMSEGKTTLNGNDVVVHSELKMNNSQLIDLETSTPLNSFKKLALVNLYYDGKQASFTQLSLKGIDILENPEKKNLLSLANLTLNDFKFDIQASTLDLALVELQQPDINATLSPDKQLTHLALIEPLLKRFKSVDKDQTNEDNKAPNKAMVIHVKHVRLTKPGLLHFNDLSVDPIFSTELHFNKIEIDHISTTNPADFKLALKQGEYTTIDIGGQGLVFDPVENLSYTVDIKQLDLPPISSYTSKTMGYAVKSGVVDTVIKGSIKQEKVDTHVVLKIDSIEVIETNKETAAEISGASGMSIDLALSTLKDENNIIDLEMPIGGDINKPDFDLSLIINKAMGSAMKSATMSYLKYALQPFSSLFTLFSLAQDAANSLSLAPISFEENSSQLSSMQKELLDKVTNILKERPGIKIKACGMSSLSDQTAINERLLNVKKQAYLKENKDKKINKKLKDAALNKITVSEKERHQSMKTLADKRAAAVKAYLIKIKGVDSSKVLNCLSAENLDKESKPLVELMI